MPSISPAQLLNHSLRTSPYGAQVARILAAALNAVEPGNAVRQYLRRDQHDLLIGDQHYDLRGYRRVLLLAFGKAALPMAQQAAQILGERLTQGLVIPKIVADSLPADWPAQLTVLPGSHPVPDQRSLHAAQQAMGLLDETRSEDLLLCLISGGGSALLSLPVVSVSLADLGQLTRQLLACGANIAEINTLRKHLSQVKGGLLARLAAPARVATLILSDSVGDSLETVASGPTVADPSTYAEAVAILERYGLLAQVPPSIRAHLEQGVRGQIAETPKPGDPLFDLVQNQIVGNNRQAALAAQRQAEQDGFHSLLLTTLLQGEARQAGPMLAAILSEVVHSGQPLPRPACLIAGGETTVTLTQTSQTPGLGGRNQELALSAVSTLAGLPQVMLVSLATDGEDGPTSAAGAVISGESLARARQAGLDPVDFLARHDAYPFFYTLGDLLEPGPTGTNVNDLNFLFAF